MSSLWSLLSLFYDKFIEICLNTSVLNCMKCAKTQHSSAESHSMTSSLDFMDPRLRLIGSNVWFKGDVLMFVSVR